MKKEEMKALTHQIIESLSENEFKGVIIMIVGGVDPTTTDVWDKIKPLFIIEEGKMPTPDPTAFMEMAAIAKERNDENEKHAVRKVQKARWRFGPSEKL